MNEEFTELLGRYGEAVFKLRRLILESKRTSTPEARTAVRDADLAAQVLWHELLVMADGLAKAEVGLGQVVLQGPADVREGSDE